VMGLGTPENPRVEGELTARDGAWNAFPFDKFESSILWEGPLIYLRHMEAIKRNGYLLRGEGRVALKDDGFVPEFLDIQLTNGDLAIVRDLWPDCKSASGAFDGKLTLRSTADGPSVMGSFSLEDGKIRAQKYFKEMENINVELNLENDRLVFTQFEGRVGRGDFKISGDTSLSGLDILDYNIKFQTVGNRGMDIEIPQLTVPPGPVLKRFSFFRDSLGGISEGAVRVDMGVTGPDGEHLIAGTLTLDDAQFTYPPAKGTFKAMAARSWITDFFTSATWDVTLETGRNAWYRNEYVNVKIDGYMRMQGHPKAWDITGRLESDRGAINYLGQSYNVKSGVFEVQTDTRTVTGEPGITPYLSGTAERTAPLMDAQGFMVPDTITMVVTRAPLGQIEPKFYSRNNPNLNSTEVAQRALGLESDINGNPVDRKKVMQQGLVQLVGSAASPLANRLARGLGISILNPIYDPGESTVPSSAANPNSTSAILENSQPGGGNYLRGTGASAMWNWSERFSSVYKVTVDERENQRFFKDQVELIYRLRGNLYMHASTDLDSERLLGQPPNRQLIFENQWRFSPPRKPDPLEGS
jgi:hypothetical protein